MAVDLPEHKGSLSIIHNDHLSVYQTVEQYIAEESSGYKEFQWKSEQDYKKAVETNELWSMRWSPSGSRAYVTIYAPTFTDLIKTMITNTEGNLAQYV